MRTADYVDKKVDKLKKKSETLAEAAWKLALLCVGWPYIFGDRGQYCTPAHRRAVYNKHGSQHPTIKSKCKNFTGTGTCTGCKFYPGGRTRGFDCRGFTYWVLYKIFGWQLMGGTVSAQWNNKNNWKAKGKIENMPKDALCCLFVYKNGKWPHAGMGLNNETIECSSGVQHFTSRNVKWTHWAVPACIDGDIHIDPTPEPEPEPTPAKKPMLKRGSKGVYVKQLQETLITIGYDVGPKGADSIFGTATEKAVKAFQKASGIKVDGIVGPATWSKLDEAKGNAEKEHPISQRNNID